MTREQAKQNLLTIGIETPTEEQVTSYLNQLNGETQRERTRADRYKADAEKTAELQAQLDTISKQNMTDSEKAKAEHEQALERIAGLESVLRQKDIAVYASSKNLVGDNVSRILDAFGDNVDTAKAAIDVISELIEATDKAARDDEKKQLLSSTPSPYGVTGGAETKPADVKNAENISLGRSAAQKDKDYYVM